MSRPFSFALGGSGSAIFLIRTPEIETEERAVAEPYLTDLRDLVDRLAIPHEITCKHFFSGAAAYVGGEVFMSLTPAGLALKLSPGDRERAIAEVAAPLRYFPKAPVKKGYAVLPAEVIDNERTFRTWVFRSIKFVRV